MAAAGVPVLPGYDGDDQSTARLEREAARARLPVADQADGRRRRQGHADRARGGRTSPRRSPARAARRAKSFGDDRVLLERFVEKGRHVEIQVFADSLGSAVHLFERDCSLQRRHQKVIEEAPAPGLDERTRSAMGAAAVAAARAVAYQGAGTVEFLYDGRGVLFPRDEHAAAGRAPGHRDDHRARSRRVAAAGGERRTAAARAGGDPRAAATRSKRGCTPRTRSAASCRPRAVCSVCACRTHAAHVRVDSGVREGDEVTVHYDPMLAKVIAWAPDRTGAIDRLRAALERTEVEGVRDQCPLPLGDPRGADAVRGGDVSTRLLEQALQPVGETPAERDRRLADRGGGAARCRRRCDGVAPATRLSPGSPTRDSV